MLVSDFINKSLYTGINQKLPSYLLGNDAIVQDINYALNDIYTYEGKDWTFMYDKHVADFSTVGDANNITVTLDYPIKRLVRLTDLSGQVTEFDILKVAPTEGLANLKRHEIYYKPWSKEIILPNNGNAGYILHYVHIFDKVTFEDELPIPDMFEGALYNGTMTYAYPPYGQYGENKEGNTYAKANQQLMNLAKTDSFQMTKVRGNIH